MAPAWNLKCATSGTWISTKQKANLSDSQSWARTYWVPFKVVSSLLLKLFRQTPLGERSAHRPNPGSPVYEFTSTLSAAVGCSVDLSQCLDSRWSLGLLQVYDTIFHINWRNPFKLQALVDMWSNFNTVIIWPQDQVGVTVLLWEPPSPVIHQSWTEQVFCLHRLPSVPILFLFPNPSKW